MAVTKSPPMSRKHRLITYALTPLVLAGGLILISSPAANAAAPTPTISATVNHVANPTKAPNSAPTVNPYILLADGGGGTSNSGAGLVTPADPPLICRLVSVTVFVLTDGNWVASTLSYLACYAVLG
ncbi:MAG TPA: hypothetical protein VMV52_10975 [Candidatus Nanopelagicaceae bacterium]|nr:hypothetical protein [Candidatus Nanopelagicaceae bacterium]